MYTRRRGFLKMGALSIASMALTQPVIATSNSPSGTDYPIGNFILNHSDAGLTIRAAQNRDQILWESAADGNFIIAELATADIHAFGTPQGQYEVVDTISATYDRTTIDAIIPIETGAAITGILSSKDGDSVGYSLVFEAVAKSPAHLRFTISPASKDAAKINRIRLLSASVKDEAFFGFGEQLTYFNQKGYLLPILVHEHGVGRGRFGVTQIVDVAADHGGGNPHITEAPAPHFISSRLRSLFLENTEYSTFDMRQAMHLDIKVWSSTMTGRILSGATPLDLIEAYTEYAGRMRVLPDWIHEGVVVSVQGGTDVARGKLETLRAGNIPVAGLWIQDWSGVRVTPVGEQLWWNWTLDESYYPGWKQLIADLERQGSRMLIYINPFLSNEAGHDAMFTEAQQKGYLVKKIDGTPYLIKNTNFFAGLIDLTNPEARTWIKEIIKTEMIGTLGASGWFADFGEALPFDSALFGEADPAVWHNHYTEEWARVNREAIEEAGRGDDIVFINRSGFTQSPGVSTLFWLGDQLQSWDEYDGIKTAVVGLLSGGVSGFSLLHSDTGGYVVLKLSVLGKSVPVIARTPELLMRWMELNAFTAVFRTHVGLDPAASAQFDTNAATLAHLERFGKIYKGLATYRKHLVAEAAAQGYPVVRHLFLHYPHDVNTHALRYQFLLGPDLMIAPVLDKGADTVEVYFPAGEEWTDLWTGLDAGKPGEWLRMPAPLGRPAVFLRKGAPSSDEILNGLKGVGVL
ncbi:MAG: alpha-glucosidase [Thermomicrobiales bacterium]